MRYYSDPNLKDIMTEIEAIQKQLEELKPQPHTAEHVAELLGWASLKVDIAEIKTELASLSQRLSKAGL
jgi:uncharacterized coiled-coil DUF342 family protein